MEQRTYSRNINVGQISQALQSHFMAQGFETQALGTPPNMLVQVRKKGALRAVAGMQRVMSAQFRDTGQGITVTLGEQKWADKAAVGAVGAIIFAPLLVTAAYGAYKQSKLPEQFWQVIDSIAMPVGATYTVPQPPAQQYAPQGQPQQMPPQSQPQQMPPQTPQQSPAPGPAQNPQIPKFCPDCGAPQQGSNFCPNCGRKHA